jgi:uncharacterized phage protein gp47/JayE
MPIYGLNEAGFTAKPLDVCLEEINARLRAVFGADVNLDPREPLGQAAGAFAEREAEIWEILADVYRAMDPDANEGDAQDAICAITGTLREPAKRSSVQVTIAGSAGTVVPKDFAASVAPGPGGARFALKAPVTIGGGGTVSAAFESEETGPVAAPAGTLTVIETPVAGVASVTNPLDATLGAHLEPAASLRIRREEELRANGAAALEAIRSDVLAVPGVTGCTVFENTTSAVDGAGLPPKSIEVLVQGGADQAIRDAIWASKSAGIETYGSTTGTVTSSQGTTHTVKFSRPTARNVFVIATLTKDAARYPADGDAQVKAAIVAAGAKLTVGDDVITRALLPGILAISGVIDVPSLKIGFAAAPTLEANLVIAVRELATFDTARITVA